MSSNYFGRELGTPEDGRAVIEQLSPVLNSALYNGFSGVRVELGNDGPEGCLSQDKVGYRTE